MKITYTKLNKIFEPLGYLILPHTSDNNSNVWHMYIKDSEYGIEYFGTVEPDTDGHSYFVINSNVPDIEREVSSPEEAIALIKKYNAKLSIPAYCIDPGVRPFANIERTFIWYMKTLGFTQPRWDEYSSCNIGAASSYTMVLKNIYGETISRITLMIDDLDKTTGSIIRGIGKGWSWVQSDFKDIESMIASINSMVEPEMLINASNAMTAVDNLTEDRTDNISLNKVDDNYSVYKINAKNALKDALQSAINKLS